MSIATEIQRLQTAKADIKSAIENKGVVVGNGTIDTYAEKISEISGGGGTVQNPLEYALVFDNVYKDVTFPEGYELNLNLSNATSLSSLFRNATGIEKLKIIGNESGNTVNAYGLVWSCSTIKVVDLTELIAKLSNIQYMCYYAKNLDSILGEIDLSECTNVGNAFLQCTNLVTITFKKETINLSIGFQHSSKLSADSIQSIIDGLADLTGGTPQKLTVHSTVGQTIVDNGWDALVTAKNWELVY